MGGNQLHSREIRHESSKALNVTQFSIEICMLNDSVRRSLEAEVAQQTYRAYEQVQVVFLLENVLNTCILTEVSSVISI